MPDTKRREEIAAKFWNGTVGYDATMNALRAAGMSEMDADSLLFPPKKFEMDTEKRQVSRPVPVVPGTNELYPSPSYAAHIWTSGDNIHLSLPPEVGFLHGHTVLFPNTPTGWLAINSILKEREKATRVARGIGHKAAPVQYDIDKMLDKLQKCAPDPKLPKQDADPNLTIEDLGL